MNWGQHISKEAAQYENENLAVERKGIIGLEKLSPETKGESSGNLSEDAGKVGPAASSLAAKAQDSKRYDHQDDWEYRGQPYEEPEAALD